MTTPLTQNNSLVGTWRLISATAIHADGTLVSDVYGANPTGYITYTPEWYMIVMFSRSDRPSLSREISSPLNEEMSAVPIAELAQAFTGFSFVWLECSPTFRFTRRRQPLELNEKTLNSRVQANYYGAMWLS